MNMKGNTFQFALCGAKDDLSLWREFHRNNGTDSWDDIRLVNTGYKEVLIEKVRIVQNRVRILDDEKTDEGFVQVLLQGENKGENTIKLAGRINNSKLNRINCLNLDSGFETPTASQKAYLAARRAAKLSEDLFFCSQYCFS